MGRNTSHVQLGRHHLIIGRTLLKQYLQTLVLPPVGGGEQSGTDQYGRAPPNPNTLHRWLGMLAPSVLIFGLWDM
jgi:hypothetical protein